MRVVQAHACVRMPWKNGGGESREIAISPTGAGLDDFDWRLSLARVEADGLFSGFPGVDRTLVLLEGHGIRLTAGDRPPLEIVAQADPISFPADIPASATLIDGTVTDFNVMTRRGRFTHRVRRARVTDDVKLEVTATITVLFCSSGTLRVRRGMETVRLSKQDSVLIEEPAGFLQLTHETLATALVVEIDKTG